MTPDARTIRGLIDWARARLWRAEALRLLRLGLLASAILGALAALAAPELLALRQGPPGAAIPVVPLVLSALPLLAALLCAVPLRPTREGTARVLDRELGLGELLVTAWDLVRRDSTAGTAALILSRAGRRSTQWRAAARSIPGLSKQDHMLAPLLAFSAALVWLVLVGTGAAVGSRPGEPSGGPQPAPADAAQAPGDSLALDRTIAALRLASKPPGPGATERPGSRTDGDAESDPQAMMAPSRPSPDGGANLGDGTRPSGPGGSAGPSGDRLGGEPEHSLLSQADAGAGGTGAPGIGDRAAAAVPARAPEPVTAPGAPASAVAMPIARTGLARADRQAPGAPLEPGDPGFEAAARKPATVTGNMGPARADRVSLSPRLSPIQRALIERYRMLIRIVETP